MSNSNPLDLIPDIDFAPQTAQEILAEMVADYEAKYQEETGEKISLVPASKERIYLNTEAYRFYLAYRLIDQGCKRNLVKYSDGAFLENLAAFWGLSRLGAQHSVSLAKFTLSAPQQNSVIIPGGTRVTTPTKVVFATKEDVIVPAGETEVECSIESLEAGTHTAGFLPGQINTLMDPIAFVSGVTNVESSQGGADEESDESLRIRIYYFDSLSVAGPVTAYVYLIKQFSQVVEDVNATNPEPGVVDVRITLTGGELPESSFIDSVYEYLEDKRPTTDKLLIAAPEITEYHIDCTFYISYSDRKRQAEIISSVNDAVEDYRKWQGSKIGRDLTPDMLTKLVMAAGAKRVPITSPVDTAIGDDHICRDIGVNVVFGGVEDD